MIWVEPFQQALKTEYTGRGPVGVMATVSEQSEPAARSVICRRIGQDGRLSFTADLRSEKIDHLRHQPSVEVVFWLSALRRQYRVSGDVRIITGGAAVGEWSALPPDTRRTFFGPPPGEAFSPADLIPDLDLTQPPPTFCVLEMLPDRVELLDLTTTPHTRQVWSRDSDWQPRRINP